MKKVLAYLVAPPAGAIPSEVKAIRYIRTSSLILAIPLLIYALYNLINGNVLFTITTTFGWVALFIINLLLLQPSTLRKAIWLILTGIYVLAVISFFGGKTQYYSLIWMACPPVTTYYLVGSKQGLRINIAFLLFVFLGLLFQSPVPIAYRSIANIMFSLIMLSATLYGYEKSREFYLLLLEDKQRELECISTTDSLTGLYNRMHIESTIERHLAGLPCTKSRTPTQCSLMLIDIDYFKSINDTYGHQEGDKVLQAVAAVILKTLKNRGEAARWGGEEFLVFIDDIPYEEIMKLAENTRSAIEKLAFENGITVTASMGVTFYCSGDTYDTFLKRADDCLYKAKAQGRNQINVTMLSF
ncbi:GGDEF domain-containing protein [Hydrogenoanaerobacterium sp.]|uniref:GGDEF domain-containing protein n=1 Tax=Hydrogenoanaerobacterium sp. TaxID=2953763 RepID=UPI00289D7C0F|nr:GGDEF domain-containing protein [Hydrogenoanaerobacterium sp.]